MANKIYYGEADGETCNRNNCLGTMVAVRNNEDGCSCHLHPPCSYCVYTEAICDVCNHNTKDPDPIINEPRELKTWCVYQTFDDVPEKDIATFVTQSEADRIVSNFKRSIYTARWTQPMRMTFNEWLKNLNKI